MNAPLQDLRDLVQGVAIDVRGDGDEPPVGLKVERPKRAGQGDYSTNAAMLLAPALKASPREIAERVGAALSEQLGPELRGFEVAGPGFVNLTLSDGWHRAALASVLDA